MTFVELLLLFFACAGITFTFVHGAIMNKLGLRPLWEKSEFLKELFHCSLCSGFWLSMIYGGLCFYLHLALPILFYIFTIPFAGSAFSFLFERFVYLLDDLIIMINKK